MRTYDLLVVGAGSGNMLFSPELAHLRSAVVEHDRFGGTCLNRGCIPSKMFVVAADAARAVGHSQRLGVHSTLDRIDWPEIRDRVFGRIDPLHESAMQHHHRRGIDVYTEPAQFVAPRVLSIGGEQVTADNIVIASGSRPVIPDIPGLDRVPFHTSDSIMRIDSVPESLLVIGGGFIAAEMGHVFGAFGSEVTIVARGPRLLTTEDEQVADRFTELAGHRHRLHLQTEVTSVTDAGRGRVAVTVQRAGGVQVLETSMLLVAAGRRPNTDRLDAAAGGLDLDEHGHLVTDDSSRTSVPGVWALGDAANHFQLKHMANAEMRVVRNNLLHPDRPMTLPHSVVPHAVFAEPQVASFGVTEQDARRLGLDFVAGVRDYADTAYGWALEDTTSFVKVLADRQTRTILGAHIIGPQAAMLLQPLLQGQMLGQTVDQLAQHVLYVHPALTEVVEQVLLDL